ncbi:hypothetical protein [Candidatus Binatus sp.]|uniref:hypothetical protein n=1 Tax=Candidatus Binatus sp. TaxID=2811406 RepID=UPI002F93C345
MAVRGGNRVVAGWSPRLGGLVVCAFFALGVMTGFSATGRAIALRASAALSSYQNQIMDSLAPARTAAASYPALLTEWAGRAGIYRRASHGAGAAALSAGDVREGAIAIVERHDGFYELFSGGELRGPVSPGKQGDLPVLSGAALDNARGPQLVDYAAVLVRAETQLSEIISEMRINDDATASLFLERERTEVVIDLDRATTEIQRAIKVRQQWQGRENLIAALDLTTPGQVVVRLHAGEGNHSKHKGGIRKVSLQPSGESTAR